MLLCVSVVHVVDRSAAGVGAAWYRRGHFRCASQGVRQVVLPCGGQAKIGERFKKSKDPPPFLPTTPSPKTGGDLTKVEFITVWWSLGDTALLRCLLFSVSMRTVAWSLILPYDLLESKVLCPHGYMVTWLSPWLPHDPYPTSASIGLDSEADDHALISQLTQ